MEVLNLLEDYGIVERKIFMLGEFWNKKKPVVETYYIVLDKYIENDDYAITYTVDLASENSGQSFRGTWADVKEDLLEGDYIKIDPQDGRLEGDIIEEIDWYNIDNLLFDANRKHCAAMRKSKEENAVQDKRDTLSMIDSALSKLREAASRSEFIHEELVASENIHLAIRFLKIAEKQIFEEGEVK